MIEFKDVCASYATEIPVLRDVSFTINDGDFVAFVGTNGAGKSTTMRLCNGLIKPTSGEVLIDGVPTTQLRVSEVARKVGFLFQNPDRQICCETVKDELLFSFKAQDALDENAYAKVDEIIETFGFDPEAEPFLLNRGTRQLLALASIVVMTPPVVILDEPTTGLDYLECEKVMQIVARLHEAGTTVIMVCHDMEVVASFAKRVIVMNEGSIVADGATFDVLRNKDAMHKANLIPPQIVDIAMQLEEQGYGEVAPNVIAANTLEEMTGALATAALNQASLAPAACTHATQQGGGAQATAAQSQAAVAPAAHKTTPQMEGGK